MEGNEKFINRYRIDSTRLRGWNYGDDGYYFVTICTKNRVEYFGDVLCDNNGEYSVALTDMGKIVRDELLKTAQIRPDVKLDAWVVMPNHVHAIIVIDNNNRRDALNASHYTRKGNEYLRVERDARGASLRDGDVTYKNVFGPQRNNLASIVRGFKSATQSRVQRKDALRASANIVKIWQPLFYDRIIRTERVLYAVRRYIIDNPKNWQRDRDNPINLWI